MSEKRVKAWAVVDASGDIRKLPGCPCAYTDEGTARFCSFPDQGERVVPVEIVYKEPGE